MILDWSWNSWCVQWLLVSLGSDGLLYRKPSSVHHSRHGLGIRLQLKSSVHYKIQYITTIFSDICQEHSLGDVLGRFSLDILR